MTVKELLHIYINSFGANYGVLSKQNKLNAYNLYHYDSKDKEKLIKDFGDRVVKRFEFENESTAGLLIYLD